jgi:hypothetical protein
MTNAADDERVRVIHEAVTYSRRFGGNWFVVHLSPSAATVAAAADLLLLRSLGIHVAAVIPEREQAHREEAAIELRKALNTDDLAAVVMTWEETRVQDVAKPHPRRWQQVGESSSLIVLVTCPAESSLRAALTLGVECSAAKLMLLDADWDPAMLPVGGPGAPVPSPEQVRPYLAELGPGCMAVATAVEAVEAGISEVHILPTRGNAHPVLLEIFTQDGIGTWIGP